MVIENLALHKIQPLIYYFKENLLLILIFKNQIFAIQNICTYFNLKNKQSDEVDYNF